MKQIYPDTQWADEGELVSNQALTSCSDRVLSLSHPATDDALPGSKEPTRDESRNPRSQTGENSFPPGMLNRSSKRPQSSTSSVNCALSRLPLVSSSGSGGIVINLLRRQQVKEHGNVEGAPCSLAQLCHQPSHVALGKTSLPWTAAVGVPSHSNVSGCSSSPTSQPDSCSSAHALGRSSEWGLEQAKGCPGFYPGESSRVSQALPFGSWLQAHE